MYVWPLSPSNPFISTKPPSKLAHGLGKEVIAEGIETNEQLKSLRELKAEYGQGYLFSRPLPAAEAEALQAKALQQEWVWV